VNGQRAHPLFQFLKSSARALPSLKWNFTKFLVSADGHLAGRFAPTTSPSSIEAEILKLL